MGGQQFANHRPLLDLRSLDRVRRLNAERGLLEMEAGATWPAVIQATQRLQPGGQIWGIRQKQTGAEDLTLGGAFAENIQGRGLTKRPFVNDVEAVTFVDGDAGIRRCSRSEQAGLQGLLAGGYGHFGIIATIRLCVAPRLSSPRRVCVL